MVFISRPISWEIKPNFFPDRLSTLDTSRKKLQWFLNQNFDEEDLKNYDHKSRLIENFVLLDDSDIISSLKVWCNHSDPVISYLANSVINRELYKIKISDQPFPSKKIDYYKKVASMKFSVTDHDVDYFVFQGSITNT